MRYEQHVSTLSECSCAASILSYVDMHIIPMVLDLTSLNRFIKNGSLCVELYERLAVSFLWSSLLGTCWLGHWGEEGPRGQQKWPTFGLPVPDRGRIE